MTKEEFIKECNENPEFAPGWQVIDDAFESIYPDGGEEHFATTMQSRALFGGDEYLDGFSVYSSAKGYKHIVSYGMTELYANENDFGREWNGWGYEMTIKLKETSNEECLWAMNMMSNLARYTNKTKRYFEAYQYVAGDGTPIRLGSDSKITALAIVPDTEIKTQMSVYGRTEFLQLVGLTTREVEAVKNDFDNLTLIISRMKEDGNVDLITDMKRVKEYICPNQ